MREVASGHYWPAAILTFWLREGHLEAWPAGRGVEAAGKGVYKAAVSVARSLSDNQEANTTNVRALLPRSSNPPTTISITNNSGQSYNIDTLHFDLVQRFGAAREITVTYTGGGLEPASTQTLNATYPATTISVLHEYDLDLSSSLSDTVLDAGETATFQIVLADFAGSNSTFIDNLAFQGTAVTVEVIPQLRGFTCDPVTAW